MKKRTRLLKRECKSIKSLLWIKLKLWTFRDILIPGYCTWDHSFFKKVHKDEYWNQVRFPLLIGMQHFRFGFLIWDFLFSNTFPPPPSNLWALPWKCIFPLWQGTVLPLNLPGLFWVLPQKPHKHSGTPRRSNAPLPYFNTQVLPWDKVYNL